jgi:hypothetical protein
VTTASRGTLSRQLVSQSTMLVLASTGVASGTGTSL